MKTLYNYQIDAVNKLKNGSILCGNVGSGKSLTAIGYYLKVCGAKIGDPHMKNDKKMNLYIITTAKKRDSCEWERELAGFGLVKDANDPINLNKVGYTVDSWNNIAKYTKISSSFFIFDEQRLVGNGSWVKSFYKISSKNQWILLSATPGDTWSDYIPVFIANGFYKNRSEFTNKHCIFAIYTKYPKIKSYINIKTLEKHLNDILVTMEDTRKTERHHEYVCCDYDFDKYRTVSRDRWDPFDKKPIKENGKLLHLMRRVVNSDENRLIKLYEIMKKHKKAIIFYNFNYEVDMIKAFFEENNIKYAQWNAYKHEEVPTDFDEWAYLVQYFAGCEGWNCTACNCEIFYSQNYSYRVLEQSRGRIDRVNTPYHDLFYYYFWSKSPIDKAIKTALNNKKNFNERRFLGKK